MVMDLYSTFPFMHIQMHFTSYQFMGESGPQHNIGTASSPLAISPNPRMK